MESGWAGGFRASELGEERAEEGVGERRDGLVRVCVSRGVGVGEGQGGEGCVRRGGSGAPLEGQLEEGVVAEKRRRRVWREG